MKILVTGAAGFIGHRLIGKLAEQGHEITGTDSLDGYYDVRLKRARLADLSIRSAEGFPYGRMHRSARRPELRFVRLNLEDREGMERLFAAEGFDAAVNLAAQAGVRYSLENPYAYVESNVLGFVNLLECCRRHPVGHLIYASSSSVYGAREQIPFREEDAVDQPVSLYAVTKRTDEQLARVYARLFGVASTGLRFFTVYGPWGRPDMAPMLFTKAILAGEPLRVFNRGEMERDFTYIEDVAEAVARLIAHAPVEEVPATIYNVGCGRPIRLLDFIRTLERTLGRRAKLELLPMQQGDVCRTYADTTRLQRRIEWEPRTQLEEGVARFAAWYLSPENPLCNAEKRQTVPCHE